jgi:hypothetical protein
MTLAFFSYSNFFPSESYVSFSIDKIHSPNPTYLRITDTSDISLLTSATDYLRLWNIYNNSTSANIYISNYTKY